MQGLFVERDLAPDAMDVEGQGKLSSEVRIVTCSVSDGSLG